MLLPLPERHSLFRRAGGERLRGRTLPAVFVLDPRMLVSAALVEAWNPLSVLRVRSGADLDARARAQLDHALASQRVHTVAVCAEASAPPSTAAGHTHLLARRRGLYDDPLIGPRLRAQGATVEALWFDTWGADVHRWDEASRCFVRLGETGVREFLAKILARAES